MTLYGRILQSARWLIYVIALLLIPPTFLGRAIVFAQTATVVNMPDFGIVPWGNNLAGQQVIMLSNGGTTVYFDMNQGRLLQITTTYPPCDQPAGHPECAFTSGGTGNSDNTGILQDFEIKNPNWRGCSTTVTPINLPYDFCSITAYYQSTDNVPNVYVNYYVSGSDAKLDVQTYTDFETRFGTTSYDLGGGSPPTLPHEFTIWATYWVHSDGVIQVHTSVFDSQTPPPCYDRWISFPFVLMVPLSQTSGAWVFDIGQDVTETNFLNPFTGIYDFYYVNHPGGTSYSHNYVSVTGTDGPPMCPNFGPPGPRYGDLTGPYSTVTTPLPDYFGIHSSDNSRGLLAKRATNTSSLVLYAPHDQDYNPPAILHELFVETRVAISNVWANRYQADFMFIPWGGSGGISRSTAQSLLSAYSPSIFDAGDITCACPMSPSTP